jgi:putative ABC transport system permease protein
MRAIQRKVVRNLWQIKGQVLAIALVITVGVAMFIAYSSTFDSLQRTQQTFYDRNHFADVFASLKRAPNHLAKRIESIDGVARVDTRVVANVTLDVKGMNEPVAGRLISIEPGKTAALNRAGLLRGRLPEPDRSDEVLLSEGFALAHDLMDGGSLHAVINGRKRELDVVGIALSPEYVYAIRPGDLMPDESRFGILWMGRKGLATAFDLEGGFNDVALKLTPGASIDDAIAPLDRLLEPYGGLGAIPRSLQVSNWYLNSEIRQLRGFGLFVPVVFLSVAAFLLNVVLRRMITVQREQIAALKALGYSNFDVGWHFTQWSLLISAFGGVLGIWLGNTLGRGMIGMYNSYFRFPFLDYHLPLEVVLGAVGFALIAAIVGALGAVREAVGLPPAEAMRPEPPASYRTSWVERLGLKRFLTQPARIVLRNLQRRPMRTMASIIGIGFSAGLLIIGLFFLDSIDVLMDLQFNQIQRQDLTVSFVEPRSAAALHEIERLPGVLDTAPSRSIAVRLRSGHHSRQTAIVGVETDPRLQRVVNTSYEPVSLPPEGLVLSSKLAETLDIRLGSTVTLEVLEGTRPVRQVKVVALVDEYIGTMAYMRLDALRRLMREGPNVTGAYMRIDPAHADALYKQIKLIPAVASVALKSAAIHEFQKQMDEMMGVFIFFNILFASIITIGVVYNVARIALSERQHELASLRVLGFTRAEISSILLGELGVLTVLAIPLGLLMGYGFAAFMVAAFDTELYRFPLIISTRTYAIAALVVLAAATCSSILVQRRLKHLDLVAVLKIKE